MEVCFHLNPLLIWLSSVFNQHFSGKHNNTENVVNSKCYDIDQIQTLKFPNKHKSLALFNINECSLSKNLDYLDHLLKSTNKVFDIIAVSETRIAKQTFHTTNINLRNYAIEFTPTEYSAGSMLFYITSHLSFKPRPDLNI